MEKVTKSVSRKGVDLRICPHLKRSELKNETYVVIYIKFRDGTKFVI